jgi:hypothetical protein
MPDGAKKLNRLRVLFTGADSLGSEFVFIYGTCSNDYPASHINADLEKESDYEYIMHAYYVLSVMDYIRVVAKYFTEFEAEKHVLELSTDKFCI